MFPLSQWEILTYESNSKCLRVQSSREGEHIKRHFALQLLSKLASEASLYPNSCQEKYQSSAATLHLLDGWWITTSQAGSDFTLFLKTYTINLKCTGKAWVSSVYVYLPPISYQPDEIQQTRRLRLGLTNLDLPLTHCINSQHLGLLIYKVVTSDSSHYVLRNSRFVW